MKYFVGKWDFYRENVETFKQIVSENPEMEFFQPSPHVAPWHVQAIINGMVLNFWPHKLKVQVEGEKSREGAKAIRRALREAQDEQDFPMVD